MKNMMCLGIFVPSVLKTPVGFVLLYIYILEIKTSHKLWGSVIEYMFVQMQHNQ